MSRWLKVISILVALLIVAFATVGVLYLTRGTPVSDVRSFGAGGPPAVRDPAFLRSVELLSGVQLKRGNSITVLTNGDETYPRLWEDLAAAERSITLQMYYCRPGRVADEFLRVVSERARAGVQVLFLFDAFGSQSLPQSYYDSLRAAGVQVALFRPVHWYSLDRASHRSHIRVVVVDGVIGYTGGFGIDDKWLGNGRQEEQWRESNVRFTGPAVLQLQATFAAGWAEATGTLLTGEIFFPFAAEDAPEGDHFAALLHTAPTAGSTPAERFLALSIAGARQSLYITNSYFVPDDDFRRLLREAAARGVDVRILTTSDRTDVLTTWHAGRARYEELLAAGIRIYEYQPTMMHAKTFVVDGLWSTVGTMNFDNRSLVFNDESNLVALDGEMGRRMVQIFLEDLEYSREILLPEFRRRPWTARVKEQAAHLMSRLL